MTTTPTPSVALKGDLPPANLAGPTYTLAVVAAGVFGRHIVQRRGKLRGFLLNERVRGAGATTVQFRRSPITSGQPANIGGATQTISDVPAEPYRSALVTPAEETIVEAGDVLDCEVTDAAAGALDLSYAPVIDEIYAK